jgi:(p)ppGpp synthase/HD superfamily hydrolase
VARIVEACSDSLADTAKGKRKAHWKERKKAYIAHLRRADEDILQVSLADKVHNARAILRNLRKPEIGEKIWARFSQPKKKTLWYYRGLAERFCEMLPGQLSNVKSSTYWKDRVNRRGEGDPTRPPKRGAAKFLPLNAIMLYHQPKR